MPSCRRASVCSPMSTAPSLVAASAVPGRVNPLRTMISLNTPIDDPDGPCFSDDVVTMGLQAATHWDALAHASYGGSIWNGYPASSVTVDRGATRCGIDKVGPVVSRGVLLDVA